MSTQFDLCEDREQPPMSAGMFTTLAAARLRSRGFEVLGQQRLEVTLRNGKRLAAARLDSYYTRYLGEPESLEQLLSEVIEGIAKGESTLRITDSFEMAAPKVLPLLIGPAEWQEKLATGLRVVVRSLVPGLALALVQEGAEAITFISPDRLRLWNVDAAVAYDRAMNNLEDASRYSSFSQTGEGERTLLVDRTADGYAATRAVLPSRLEDWSMRVPGSLVLGLPSRDLLLGFSSFHPQVRELARQVREDATGHEHGLMPELLVYNEGRLETFMPLEEAFGEGE